MSSLSKEELLFMTKACEQAGEFQDMLFYAKQLILQTNDPTIEERNLLSLAFQLNFSNKRSSWRVACGLERKELAQGHSSAHLVVQLRKTLEKELIETCFEFLSFVKDNLLKDCFTANSRVFFNKMRGDYYRYISECFNGNEKSKVLEKGLAAYEQATEIAEAELKVTDPVRLRLALNFSTFCYDFLGNGTRCKEISRKAFDDAVGQLDEISEDEYKEVIMIMQLLRDNITL